MIHLVYESTASAVFVEDELPELLVNAQARNAADDVSGLLLYDKGAFFQVLEGPDDKVRACFSRIAKDPRHKDILKLVEVQARRRNFDCWHAGMAGAENIPAYVQETIREFQSIHLRLRLLRSRRPEAVGEYYEHVCRSFLSQIDHLSVA